MRTSQKMVVALTFFDDEAQPETFRQRGDALMLELASLAEKHGLYYGGTSSFRDVER